MFPDLFHIERQGDCLQLSIRSAESRADAYSLTRSDIEPALDDDPTDNEWSGTDRFAMKRTPQYGLIRIGGSVSVIFKVSRHHIEVLNARLKAAIVELPLSSQPIEPQYAIRQEFDTITAPINNNELIAEIRTVIQEELRKINLQPSQPVPALPVEPVQIEPSATFIPSNLGEGLAGQVQASTKKSDGKSALEASKKLRRLKK